MKIKTEAHLLDTLTGERAVEVRDSWGHDDDEVIYDDRNILYWWTEGNGSCDCNRALALYRQYGFDLDVECGDDRFVLERLVVDGRDIISQTSPPAPKEDA